MPDGVPVFNTGQLNGVSVIGDGAIDPHYTMADGSPTRAITPNVYPMRTTTGGSPGSPGSPTTPGPWLPDPSYPTLARWIIPAGADGRGD